MAIPAFPAIVLFVMCLLILPSQKVRADLPRLNSQESLALEQVQDGPDVQGPSFELMARHVLNANETDASSDEPVRIRMTVDSILASPEDVRGVIFRVEGSLLESRRMPTPHQSISEWMMRLVSGEPVVVYLPTSQAAGFDGDGQVVSIESRFFRNIEVRSRDGQLRGYPTFFGAYPVGLGRGKTIVWEQMDILMLLGFMILLVVVGLLVMTMARRQGRRHPVRSARLIENQSPIADDPVAALETLRSQSERNHS